jgi:hypothetical protein
MKKILLFFAASFLCAIGYAQISEFPYNEGFESGSVPSGWTQQHIDSSLNWKVVTSESLPSNPHGGSYKAIITATGSGHKTRLISPALQLVSAGVSNPVLKFWHAERASGSEYDELEIFYRTSATGEWISLRKFSETPEWTEAAISLPNPTDDYYIAFQATIHWGYGVHLDDISIEAVSGIDGQAVKLFGVANPMVGEAFAYKAHIRNLKTEPLTGYTVKLIDGIGNTLATSSNNPNIALGQTEVIELLWTPATTGSISLRAVLEMVGDINPANDSTNAITANVQAAADEYQATIGTNTNFATAIMPFGFFYVYARTQNLYYAHELAGQNCAVNEIQYSTKFSTARNNIPVKIWMANTELEALGRWLPESEFTLVYDGTKNFPRGYETVSFTLDQPFIREKGKNLVIMIDRSVGGGINNMEVYHSQSADFSNRSRYYNADLEEFTWSSQQPGTGTNMFPNTIIKMSFEVGSVSGKVTVGTEPVANAVVKISGTNLEYFTDSDGNYNINLVPGEYNLEVSKYGYITQTLPVTITASGNVTKDINLIPLPEYTVSGKVIGSNAPEGLKNVKITLSGYKEYTATTDESGNYSIENVYKSDYAYNIRAELETYVGYDSVLNVIDNAVTHNILLYEDPYRVMAPVVEEQENNAVVNWGTPIASDIFRYDNGVKGGRLGFTNNSMTPAFYDGVFGSVYKENTTLYSVSWFTDTISIVEQADDVDVFIFGLDSTGWPDANNLLYRYNDVSNTPLQWSEFEFPEPINLPDGFLIGLSASNGWYLALGSDSPDEEYPFQDLTHFYNSSYTIVGFETFTTSNVYRNPMLRAEGVIHGKETALKPAPVGYIVYRLSEGQEEEAWTRLADNITDTAYTDTEWANLPDGIYRYAVKAKYLGADNISKPVLTNTLIKGNAGIAVIKEPETLVVYPNPVTNVLNIQTDVEIEEIAVIDQNGKVVKTQKGGNGVSNKSQIDLHELSAGYYVVRVSTTKGNKSVKIVKQ